MTATTAEERVRRLEDLEAINTLLLAYGRYLDTKDWGPYSRLFADDGEFVAGIGSAVGPAEIEELFDSRLKDIDPGLHVITNVRVDLDRDRATSSAIWMYVCPGDDGWPRMLQCGRYADVLTRTDDGRWLFKRREVTRDMGSPPYQK